MHRWEHFLHTSPSSTNKAGARIISSREILQSQSAISQDDGRAAREGDRGSANCESVVVSVFSVWTRTESRRPPRRELGDDDASDGGAGGRGANVVIAAVPN